MPASIDDIIGTARLPEQTLRLCLRGDLIAEHQAAEAELRAVKVSAHPHLAEADPRTPIAQRIQALEDEMAQAETPFTFRALGRRKYRELLAAHPPRGDRDDEHRFNADTFPRALIAACCVDPEGLTEIDVDRLFDVLQDGAVEALFMAAYTVNEGVTRVPFSKAASELTARLEPKS